MGLTLLFGAGSLLTSFAVTLNHCIIASMALLGAAHLLIRLSVEERDPTQPIARASAGQ